VVPGPPTGDGSSDAQGLSFPIGVGAGEPVSGRPGDGVKQPTSAAADEATVERDAAFGYAGDDFREIAAGFASWLTSCEAGRYGSRRS